MKDELIPFEQFQADKDEFYRAMMSTDDVLGTVIRAAIYIENQLIKLIEENTCSIKAIDRMKLTYEGRLNLAIALGLREDLLGPLKALGNIRNKFAHVPDAKLDEAEANDFYKSFGSDDRTKLEHIYQRTRKYPGVKRPAKFSSLSSLERFTFCAITLRGVLIVARKQSADIATFHSRAAQQ